MKKTILILVLLIIISSVSYGEISPWAEKEVYNLKKRKIIKEDFFNDYKKNITRKEFAYLSVKLYEKITGMKTEIGDDPFDDTDDEYVLKGYNEGFIKGYGNGKFYPDNLITREEIATLYIRILKKANKYLNSETNNIVINDIDKISSWALDNIKLAQNNGIMNGVGSNKMAPKENTTKEQAMIMTERILVNYYDLSKTLLNGLKDFDKKIDVSRYSIQKNEISGIVHKLIDNNPEIFYYDGMSYTYSNNKIINITFKYIDGEDSIIVMRNELKNKVEKIINNRIEANMSDYEKEKILHDYIVKNTEYDREGINANVLSHTAYGTLVNGKSVCDGYAGAIDLLLKEVGIPSVVINGTAEGIPHSWNLVTIDGMDYYLDVTYDDPLPDRGDTVMYSYFNINERMLKRDHEWEDKLLPEVVSLKHNYYYYNKLYFDETSEFNNYIQTSIKNENSDIHLKVDDVNKYDLTNTIRELNYSIKYSYSVDSLMDTFYIKLLPRN